MNKKKVTEIIGNWLDELQVRVNKKKQGKLAMDCIAAYKTNDDDKLAAYYDILYAIIEWTMAHGVDIRLDQGHALARAIYYTP